MTELQLFSPVAGADYLAIGDREIIWFKDAEAYPEEPDDICPPQWATIACGWQSGPTAQEGEIGGDDLSAIAEGVIAKPLAGYPVVRLISSPLSTTMEDRRANGVTFEPTTPVFDPGLPGLFRVSYVAGAAGLAYSEGIQGYQIFVTVPLGYVIVIVGYDDDVRVGAVLRPADKPQGLSMMEFLDLSIEALGIEALDHDLDLHAPG